MAQLQNSPPESERTQTARCSGEALAATSLILPFPHRPWFQAQVIYPLCNMLPCVLRQRNRGGELGTLGRPQQQYPLSRGGSASPISSSPCHLPKLWSFGSAQQCGSHHGPPRQGQPSPRSARGRVKVQPPAKTLKHVAGFLIYLFRACCKHVWDLFLASLSSRGNAHGRKRLEEPPRTSACAARAAVPLDAIP